MKISSKKQRCQWQDGGRLKDLCENKLRTEILNERDGMQEAEGLKYIRFCSSEAWNLLSACWYDCGGL